MNNKDFEQNGMKNCPFCNSRPTLTCRSSNTNSWKVVCNKHECQGASGEFDDRQEARDAWNKRINE